MDKENVIVDNYIAEFTDENWIIVWWRWSDNEKENRINENYYVFFSILAASNGRPNPKIR